MKIKEILKPMAKFISKHAPEILTGVGVVGMGSAVVAAVKATPKAQQLLYDEMTDQQKEKLTVKETVKTVWKCYIPTAIIMVGAGACVIFANKVSIDRQAALAAAYAISERAARTYKDKVIEVIGEQREKTEVHDAIVQDQLDADDPNTIPTIVMGNNKTLCKEAWTGQYFYSSRDEIISAVNELNSWMLADDTVCINDLIDILGCDMVKCKTGDTLGWNVEYGIIHPSFTSSLAANGTPCLVLDYDIEPRADANRWRY